jgi:RNA polymerase sigma-70 factor, ECF subfamily
MYTWSQELHLGAIMPGTRRMTGAPADDRAIDTRLVRVDFGRAHAVPGMRDQIDVIPTDAELMARIVAGDQQAFAAVYDRHAQMLFGTIMRYLRDSAAAEDILQETFLAMWTRSERYSSEAGSLIAWLLTIARNRAIDRLRSVARQPVAVGLASGATEGADDDLERMLSRGRPVGSSDANEQPADLAERRWIRAVVRTAIDDIPDDERLALELAYDDELTQAEIADRLGWPLGTVKTRTKRALLRLRMMLENVPDIGPSSGLRPVSVNGRDSEEGRHGSH